VLISTLIDCRKEVQETSWWGSGGIPQLKYSPKIGGFRGVDKDFFSSLIRELFIFGGLDKLIAY
jgi:hypothetical protein